MLLIFITTLLATRYAIVASIDAPCVGDISCTHGGRVYCGHIPCLLEPCDVKRVLEDGACCPHCPTESQ